MRSDKASAAPPPLVVTESDRLHRTVRPIWAEVSLDAITANLSEVKRRIGRKVKIIAPVKADAYGHGVVPIGRHLQDLGVDGVATANFDDALALRRSGFRKLILMFASNLPEGAEHLVESDLTPTVCDVRGAEMISMTAKRLTNVHVKVDAGLGRVGVKLREAKDFILKAAELPNVNIEGVYTHIAFSDEEGEAWARRRLEAFTGLIEELESAHGLSIKYAQASASSTLVCGVPDRLNTIAPGHLLFGLSPVKASQGDMSGLTTALKRVAANLIQVSTHRAGDDIAVSGRYGLRKSTRTGVVLLGLDNGLRMPLTGDGYMLCRGKRCAILSVTAEYTVIDLTGVRDAQVGDRVTVIGTDGEESISLDHVARYLGVGSAAALLVNLRRIPIHYLKQA